MNGTYFGVFQNALIISSSKIRKTNSEIRKTSSELIQTSSELISTSSELISTIAALFLTIAQRTDQTTAWSKENSSLILI